MLFWESFEETGRISVKNSPNKSNYGSVTFKTVTVTQYVQKSKVCSKPLNDNWLWLMNSTLLLPLQASNYPKLPSLLSFVAIMEVLVIFVQFPAANQRWE